MLSFFAKIRRYYLRLPTRGRIFFFAGSSVVLLAIIVVPAVRAINNRIFPFFDPAQTYFVDIRPSDGTEQHLEAAAVLFSSIFKLPREEIFSILSAAMESEPSRFGTFLQDGTVHFYARNPLRPIILPDNVKEQWVSTELQLQRDTYFLFTPSAAAQFNHASINAFWRKIALYRLAAQDRGVIYLKSDDFPQPLYGSFADLGGAWRVNLSPSAWKLGQGGESANIPRGASFFLRQKTGVGAIAERVAWTENIAAIWNSPLAQIFRLPGEITVAAGTYDVLLDNPFRADVSWQAAVTTSQGEAGRLTEQILRDLAKRYPMAFERVLPDKSKVYELKIGAEQFLNEGSAIDLAVQPQGVMTYPQGQVVYSFGDDTLRLEHGDAAAKVKFEAFSCGVPDPELEILVAADFVGTKLWRNVFFGLNKRNGVVCIYW